MNKIFWIDETLLFYRVGYNTIPCGRVFIIARFWKWGYKPKGKQQGVFDYFNKRNQKM